MFVSKVLLLILVVVKQQQMVAGACSGLTLTVEDSETIQMGAGATFICQCETPGPLGRGRSIVFYLNGEDINGLPGVSVDIQRTFSLITFSQLSPNHEGELQCQGSWGPHAEFQIVFPEDPTTPPTTPPTTSPTTPPTTAPTTWPLRRNHLIAGMKVTWVGPNPPKEDRVPCKRGRGRSFFCFGHNRGHCYKQEGKPDICICDEGFIKTYTCFHLLDGAYIHNHRNDEYVCYHSYGKAEECDGRADKFS